MHIASIILSRRDTISYYMYYRLITWIVSKVDEENVVVIDCHAQSAGNL